MSYELRGDVSVGKDLSISRATTVTGGLKDADVSTAIKLGDALNTSLTTTNKTIIGSINELQSSTGNYVTLTGDQSIDGTKTFTSTISGSISGDAATVGGESLATLKNDMIKYSLVFG